MILHILTQTAPHQSFASAIKSIHPQDNILLMGDGVYSACIKSALAELTTSHAKQVFALKPDCESRGMLGQLPDSIHVIDDAGFVDQVCAHEKSITWY